MHAPAARCEPYLPLALNRTDVPRSEHLPQEIDFLRGNDEAMRRIMNTVGMPEKVAENVGRSIRLREGKLGRKRARHRRAAAKTRSSVRTIQTGHRRRTGLRDLGSVSRSVHPSETAFTDPLDHAATGNG
jgi:hypothetical protein